MVEAALRIPQLLLNNSWDFTEQKPIIKQWINGDPAITIWKAGKAQLESKRAAVDTCAEVRASKTGIGGRGAASTSPTLNGIDWI